MSINFKSVIISGLVAGLIINVSGILMVPMVGKEMEVALLNRGLPPMGGGAMAFFGIMSLILGMFIVWLYATLIESLGSGPKTALIVSLVVWFLTYFWANASMVAYGFMPVLLTVIGTICGLVELVVAGQVGARLYKKK
jgi:hypothetical protein